MSIDFPSPRKDPKRVLLFVVALLPFLVATLYISVKPAPKRLKRTHGGSTITRPAEPAAPAAQPPTP
jgi:hypothetical protein